MEKNNVVTIISPEGECLGFERKPGENSHIKILERIDNMLSDYLQNYEKIDNANSEIDYVTISAAKGNAIFVSVFFENKDMIIGGIPKHITKEQEESIENVLKRFDESTLSLLKCRRLSSNIKPTKEDTKSYTYPPKTIKTLKNIDGLKIVKVDEESKGVKR